VSQIVERTFVLIRGGCLVLLKDWSLATKVFQRGIVKLTMVIILGAFVCTSSRSPCGTRGESNDCPRDRALCELSVDAREHGKAVRRTMSVVGSRILVRIIQCEYWPSLRTVVSQCCSAMFLILGLRSALYLLQRIRMWSFDRPLSGSRCCCQELR